MKCSVYVPWNEATKIIAGNIYWETFTGNLLLHLIIIHICTIKE